MKNKFTLIVLGLILAFTLNSCGGGSGDKELLNKYKAVAKEVNKMTPMKMADIIVLDKAEAVEGGIFKYYYTFEEEPVVTVDEFIKNAKSEITSNLKVTASMKEFKKDGITLIYVYRKNDKTTFAEIEIKADEY